MIFKILNFLSAKSNINKSALFNFILSTITPLTINPQVSKKKFHEKSGLNHKGSTGISL